MSRLLSVSTVASALGVSPGRVRQLISKGRLKALKVPWGARGHVYAIRSKDLKAFVRWPPGRPKKPPV